MASAMAETPANPPTRTERVKMNAQAMNDKIRDLNPLDEPDFSDDTAVASNLVGGAIQLGLTIIMIIMMALIAGYFVANAPSDGAFSQAINTTSDTASTGFIIMGVSVLAIPAVSVVAYFYRSGLGGFIGGNGRGR